MFKSCEFTIEYLFSVFEFTIFRTELKLTKKHEN
jgi:hypothetical protein